MTNRLKKKLRKRNGFRKYVNYRGDAIDRHIRNCGLLDKYEVVNVITSRNNKHIIKVYGLTDVYPSAMNYGDETNNSESHMIDFDVSLEHPMQSALFDTENAVVNTQYSKLIESWKEWISVNAKANEERSSHEASDRMDFMQYWGPIFDQITAEYEKEGKESPLEEMMTMYQQEPNKHLLEMNPIVHITNEDIKDATEPCDRYQIQMPKDIDDMSKKIAMIRSRDCVILSVFPGIVDDLYDIAKTYYPDMTGVNTVRKDADGKRYGEINVSLLLDRLLEATEDNMRFIILPWCPGIRITLSTFKIHYAYIRPEFTDRYEFVLVANKCAELNEHPIEAYSYTNYMLTFLEKHWDAFFTEKIASYEHLEYSGCVPIPVSPTILYRPRVNVGTGLYQLEEQILKEFDREILAP